MPPERTGGSKGMICATDKITPGPAEMIGLADSKTKSEREGCPIQEHVALTLQRLH